jgi:hypothetical protein
MRCEYLRLTPQALRLQRFAVGKAGSRSSVMGVFPAQQKRSDGPDQRDESGPSSYRARPRLSPSRHPEQARPPRIVQRHYMPSA